MVAWPQGKYMAEDQRDHIESSITPTALVLRVRSDSTQTIWHVTRYVPDRLSSPTPAPQSMPALWAQDPDLFVKTHQLLAVEPARRTRSSRA